jgi:hypothetical protein
VSGRITTATGAGVFLGVLAAGAAAAAAVIGISPADIRAIGLAAGVTGGAAVAGWAAARWGRGRDAGLAVAGGLGATVVRLLPVLVVLGWIVSREEGMDRDRAGALLVVFYLLMLATDILLNMMNTAKSSSGPGGTPPN